MSFYGKKYIEHVKNIIDKVVEKEYSNIEKAAEAIANAVKNNNTIFAFGCSHAGILVEELFYRTGGLALLNPIFNSTLMLNTRPITMTSKMERLEGFGEKIICESPLKKGDVILIHSVSGRNPVSIEAAIKAKEIGAYVIAVTNLTYSNNVTSRHSSNKKLYEVADLVIDNCGDFEDACMKIEGIEQKVCPTSTAVGAAIVNAMVVEVAAKLVELGIEPPIFHSANVDGGDEFNKKIFEKYGDKIYYMN